MLNFFGIIFAAAAIEKHICNMFRLPCAMVYHKITG